MSDIEFQFEPIAKEYGKVEADPVKSRYELEVNWPSIQKLLPPAPAKILDYGCGSGVYSQKLSDQGYDVIAADNSPTMIIQTQARGIRSIQWSYQDSPLARKFDLIVAKLVVQFVTDLAAFALAMRKALSDQGKLIISIPHPERSSRLINKSGKDNVYRVEVGISGLSADMIHRDTEVIVGAICDAGFKLAKTDVPQDRDKPQAEPKRLNLLFEAI